MRKDLVPIEHIESKILLLRGQKVMLDSDLAELYGVETKVLNRMVKRNIKRFPEDFMLRLTIGEVESLRCQIGTSNLRSKFATSRRGGRRYLPYAFTEQGVAMLSSVLKSSRAVQVNIEIMRAFVRLRRLLASNAELARKLNELERRYNSQFRVVFDAIRELMTPLQEPEPELPPQRRIGFTAREKARRYSIGRKR
ncbi:MAG: ORF6N domain-containing protein [bacterium]|nr:ORF6N domain-containing protein [bacterium]